MNIKNISLGIIDLLAIMIPGIIWVSLIFYLHAIFRLFDSEFIRISKELKTVFPNNWIEINTFSFLFYSYVIGYLSRLIPISIIDRITSYFISIQKNGWSSLIKVTSFTYWLQPYEYKYSHQFKIIKDLLKGSDNFINSSIDFHPFFICKRFLLQNSPQLWSEAQRREAEIRLISGIFYPIIVLSSVSFFNYQMIYGLSFLCVAIFLCYVFRRRRYAEITFAISATYILLKNIK